jgi:hypothetical protein
MKKKEYVAERKLVGINVDGERIGITVAVGVPYKDDKYDSWACPLKVEGLFNQLSDQHGIDSWQAFRLSQKTVVSLLHGFLDKGGKLYIFGEDKEMTNEEIDEFF